MYTAKVESGQHRVILLDRARAEELIAEARDAGFDSAAYMTLREHLWSYAMPVIKDALRTGKVARLLNDRNIFQAITASDRSALHTSIESRDDLAVDIVAAGEHYLKNVTIPKDRWEPNGGASIETFFLTGCLFQFPAVYRRWSKERTDHHSLLVGLLPDAFAASPTAFDTEDTAVNSEMARAVFREADNETRAILALLATGRTHAEIGERVGLSERAVEGRVYRFKIAVRRALSEKPPRRRTERAA